MKVLAIEQNEDFRKLVELFFVHKLSLDVVSCGDVGTALHILREDQEIDLIVTDTIFPDLEDLSKPFIVWATQMPKEALTLKTPNFLGVMLKDRLDDLVQTVGTWIRDRDSKFSVTPEPSTSPSSRVRTF